MEYIRVIIDMYYGVDISENGWRGYYFFVELELIWDYRELLSYFFLR